MLKYRSAVVVNRPPEIVFQYLADPAKQALWSDVPMRKLTEGHFTTGSRIEVTFGKGPLSAKLGLEFTDVQPGQRMAWRSFSGPIDWDGEYRLAPAGEAATELSQEGRLRFKGLWRILEPLVVAEMRGNEEKELERLKAAAEAS